MDQLRDLALAKLRDDRKPKFVPDVPYEKVYSDWLENPMEYTVPTYAHDMVTLIARLDVESVHWVGTSLGGLIGMSLAAMRGSPIKRLVLNDVGPVLTAVSLERLSSYVGKWPPLPTIEAAELFVRSTSASFGPHTDAEWRFLTEHVVRKNADADACSMCVVESLALLASPPPPRSVSRDARFATASLVCAGAKLSWSSASSSAR